MIVNMWRWCVTGGGGRQFSVAERAAVGGGGGGGRRARVRLRRRLVLARRQRAPRLRFNITIHTLLRSFLVKRGCLRGISEMPMLPL
jgi:hypothetical protein